MNSGSRECERVLELLPDFAVGAGTARERDLVQSHVTGCPECARELHALQSTALLIERTPMEQAPDLWDAIMPRLEPRQPSVRPSGFMQWFRIHKVQSALTAAAATAAVALTLLIGNRAPLPSPDAQMASNAQGYFASYASMNWREPFADTAGLGLMSDLPVEVSTEVVQ